MRGEKGSPVSLGWKGWVRRKGGLRRLLIAHILAIEAARGSSNHGSHNFASGLPGALLMVSQ